MNIHQNDVDTNDVLIKEYYLFLQYAIGGIYHCYGLYL